MLRKNSFQMTNIEKTWPTQNRAGRKAGARPLAGVAMALSCASMALFAFPAGAQSLQSRLEFSRQKNHKSRPALTQSAWGETAKTSASTMLGSPYYISVAQLSAAGAPERPARTIGSSPDLATNAEAPPSKEVTVFTDLQFGSDKQQFLVATPAPSLVEVRRQIRNLVVTAQYPLSDRSNIAVSIPYISQSVSGNAPGISIDQRGSGVGDIGVFVGHRFPEIARGTELSVTTGMLFPTGKSPFELGENELPTGVGFYQPLIRARISKMRVPLQFYGAVDYSTSLSRDVNGSQRKLPPSYGLEAGFYYSLSPEFTTQTSVKWNKISSPFTAQTASTVAYLSQGLIYTRGSSTSFQASVDAGLTDEAIDFLLTLTLIKSF